MTHSKSKLSPSFAWLLLLALAASQPAQALQVVDARDGETVLAKVSRKEVTRISVDRGRIRKVTGNAGEFVLEKDGEKGQVFIRPAAPDSTKPINLFVSTERSTIGLLLQPVDTPSDAIVIREARDAATGPARIERSGRHVRTMKNLLLAMAEDALPDDMEVREPGRELTLWPGARLTLQRQWLGAGVVGEKYQLLNTGASTLDLAERDLYKRGVMAVSVEQAALRSGETTQLFVIRERRADD
ncbi:MAG: type-F conjugative transfer system secretin TraK [Piscinibacter sp.]|uniref:type-F conjugative transfer system secretin TraK n=1 Tax=Piscinibacter sp. TaxID=1903157 RepID=UPI001B621278|nr:type-F conjugative transfer system secretin TraK [Piscinibacter sp.]MBP5990771.1 type-F conjugative transfer system secretin TraK [Piscinibacter sp.]MBP6029787.1 type-F conjugative transfer system secretin TraK [Piscinibacter sp.]